MALPERREPTHIMRIDVPLFEPAAEDADFDAFRDVLRLVLELSRAAQVGVICGDPQVSIKAAEKPAADPPKVWAEPEEDDGEGSLGSDRCMVYGANGLTQCALPAMPGKLVCWEHFNEGENGPSSYL